jgi:hypothetical protein
VAARAPVREVNPWSPRFTLERIGHLISRTILTALYAILLAPVGLIFRLFADPLRVGKAPSTWSPWGSRNDSVDQARAQG